MMQMNAKDVETVRTELRAAAQEMNQALAGLCVSDMTGRDLDLAAAIADGSGTVVAADNLAHLGSMALTIETIITKAGFSPQAGDAILTNDPYGGGVHVQDFTLLSPVAQDGQTGLHLAVRSHMPDIGGDVRGSYDQKAEEIWGEGVRITPVRIRRGGAEDRAGLHTVLLNTRAADEFAADVEGMLAALETGRRRVVELMGYYGPRAFRQALDQHLRAAEKSAREVIRRWPDGEHTAERSLASDGKGRSDLTVRVRAVVRGDSLELDLRETDAQSRSFVNSSRGNTLRCALLPVVAALGDSPDVAIGALRGVQLSTQAGTLVDPLYPAATGWSPFHVGREIAQAVAAALDGFLPSAERVADRIDVQRIGSALPKGYVGPQLVAGER